MYNVSAAYKAAANAKGRNVTLKVNLKTRLYNAEERYYYWQMRETHYSHDNIIGIKIVEGQTTGAFRLGDTVCPVLTLTLSAQCTALVNDIIEVFVSFDNGGSWFQLVGDFLADTVDKRNNRITIQAYGTMIVLSKNYDSALTFPAQESAILSEALAKNNIGAGYTLLTDAYLTEKPIKGTAEDGSTLYYTRRELYGYIAAANGGSAYINNKNQLCFSTPRETGETFTHEQVISENIGSKRTIDSLLWNTSGLSYSLGDDYDENTLEFYNPLPYSANEQILSRLHQALMGLEIDGAIIKKNGCGYFELGDKVTYIDLNGNSHNLLVMGIVYEFTNSYFSETLYSLTNTTSQRNYAGQQVMSNHISGSESGDGGGTADTAKRLQTDESYAYAETATQGIDVKNRWGGTFFAISAQGDGGKGGMNIEYDPYDTLQGRLANSTKIYLNRYYTSTEAEYNDGYGNTRRTAVNVQPHAVQIIQSENSSSGSRTSSTLEYALPDSGAGAELEFRTGDSDGNSFSHTLSFKADGLYLNGKKVLTEE